MVSGGAGESAFSCISRCCCCFEDHTLITTVLGWLGSQLNKPFLELIPCTPIPQTLLSGFHILTTRFLSNLVNHFRISSCHHHPTSLHCPMAPPLLAASCIASSFSGVPQICVIGVSLGLTVFWLNNAFLLFVCLFNGDENREPPQDQVKKGHI